MSNESRKSYLSTKEYCVGYGRKILLENIEFQVPKGEIVTLIGPNGSGKTTILKSIGRQIEALGGTVYIQEQAAEQIDRRTFARRVATVFTGRMQTEHMSCREVASMGRYPYTGNMGVLSQTDHKKVQECMELVHVSELADRDFMKISDGQKQRVLLAGALCQEPELLLLDEPTSFLDIRHKMELLDILKSLSREKELTVVMSLHELDLAQKVSDHILCVGTDGQLRYGSPEEIFTQEYIHQLYHIQEGSFNPRFGSLELIKPEGVPKVFVIAGNGSGADTYRRLQKEGICFATGVLHENDIDLELARSLTDYVITTPAFEPVSEEALKEAMDLARQCEEIICCLDETDWGSMNEANRQLLQQSDRTDRQAASMAAYMEYLGMDEPSEDSGEESDGKNEDGETDSYIEQLEEELRRQVRGE